MPPFKGTKICRMTMGQWVNEIVKERHPWLRLLLGCGVYHNDEPDAIEGDQWAVNNGYVAITPTKIDVTDYEIMDKLNS